MKLNKAQKILMSSSLTVFLAGCGAPNYSPSETHITAEEVDSERLQQPDSIPSLVKSSPGVPSLDNSSEEVDTYDVVVTNVPVRDLLFALARDSGINMDVDDEVGGLVTMSALDQTLDAILARIGKQIPIRVESIGNAILVRPDSPFTKIYRVDFLNVTRTYSSSANTSGVGAGESAVSNTATNDFWNGMRESISALLLTEYLESDGSSGIVANLPVSNESEELRADRLGNVSGTERRLLAESSFNLNSETGVLSVYSSGRIHNLVQELLDSMVSIAKRQVLLEATVVEVVLNNQYSQGIDWALFNSLAEDGLALYQGGVVGGAAAALTYLTREFESTLTSTDSGSRAAAIRQVTGQQTGLLGPNDSLVSSEIEVEEIVRIATKAEATTGSGFVHALTGGAAIEGEEITVYRAISELVIEQRNEEATRSRAGGLSPTGGSTGLFQAAYRQGDLSAAVSLLDSFGDAKVLSSPRISALNYQPALLRVVDQEVYFNITVNEDINEDTGQATSRTYEVTENTVDIGFAMNVLPQISADGEIILNLKPSVTRILDYRNGVVPAAFSNTGGASAVQNLIPITRVRELESVISLRDGEVAVLGGLLEDRTGDSSRSVPGLGSLPGIGALFSNKDESTYKTEFVVFIRARIIKNPSINGDYSHYRHLLPNSDFIIRDTEGTFLPPKQIQ